MFNMNEAMEMCHELKQDGTCNLKENTEKQYCTINPKMCCAMCACEQDESCDAKKGICTILY